MLPIVSNDLEQGHFLFCVCIIANSLRCQHPGGIAGDSRYVGIAPPTCSVPPVADMHDARLGAADLAAVKISNMTDCGLSLLSTSYPVTEARSASRRRPGGTKPKSGTCCSWSDPDRLHLFVPTSLTRISLLRSAEIDVSVLVTDRIYRREQLTGGRPSARLQVADIL